VPAQSGLFWAVVFLVATAHNGHVEGTSLHAAVAALESLGAKPGTGMM